MVATDLEVFARQLAILSVRFSSRQWLLHDTEIKMSVSSIFQSAFHRGNGCYAIGSAVVEFYDFTFSPLFIAAMVATLAFVT